MRTKDDIITWFDMRLAQNDSFRAVISTSPRVTPD
jgi:hypothetical protein